MDPKKIEMFLQVVNDGLEDRHLLFLEDKNTKGGFTNNWKKMDETVILMAK